MVHTSTQGMFSVADIDEQLFLLQIFPDVIGRFKHFRKSLHSATYALLLQVHYRFQSLNDDKLLETQTYIKLCKNPSKVQASLTS
jgi:hypothetical protein